jgi:hypothetical protein
VGYWADLTADGAVDFNRHITAKGRLTYLNNFMEDLNHAEAAGWFKLIAPSIAGGLE